MATTLPRNSIVHYAASVAVFRLPTSIPAPPPSPPVSLQKYRTYWVVCPFCNGASAVWTELPPGVSLSFVGNRGHPIRSVAISLAIDVSIIDLPPLEWPPRLGSMGASHLFEPLSIPSLRFGSFETFYDTWPTLAILLPTVTTISVQGNGIFLRLLTAPALRHLIFTTCSLYGLAEDLVEFLDRSGCRLESLELQGTGSHFLQPFYNHPAISSSLTRLAIPSWDLATLFCAIDEASKGHALTPRLRSFGLKGLCFQIDNCLEHDPSDETNGVLANLLLSWFPSLAVLEMDLEMFTRDELESRLVSTVQGQFTVTRPTYRLEQYRNHGPQDGYSGFPGTNFESDLPLCGRQLIYGR
ncbi:hypothetical protein K438DRAFT_1773455 [Mycena galopus ATCC 62051]|nr:hypothetical protein K438DRAFT_1773455 [Mycena galopus ATCC 62051]